MIDFKKLSEPLSIDNIDIGIYKITNPKGKIYIGQSSNLKQRLKDYKKTIHCKGQKKLFFSLNKYGFSNHNFEIIEKCDFFNINERERYWQDYYNVLSSNGLNCKLTSTKDKKLKLSLCARKKISDYMKINNPMFSEKTKNIFRKRFKGENNPMFGKFGDKNPASKKIINTIDNMIFQSIKEASDYSGIKYSTLKSMINGTNKNKTNYIYLTKDYICQ